MKIAPLIRAIEKYNTSPKSNQSPISYILVHTGQHYDIEMSEAFFRDLDLPTPDINLGVGSGSHAAQTAEIMKRFERVLLQEKPDVVIVVGDVNSTLACALVTSKIEYGEAGSKTSNLHRRRPLIAHVEAGLRSFDRTMPEEINRIVTDALADFLFTPSKDADENLLKEGIPANKIKRVGNIMIDTLVANLEEARRRRPDDQFGLKEKSYVFVTLHRPSNVDSDHSLSLIMKSLDRLSQELAVIFPVHPRTKRNLMKFGLWPQPNNSPGLKLCEPLGYHDSIGLVDKARFVLTDSGGLQEETTFLNIPCLTLRPNTERPITLTQGTNKLTSLPTLDQDLEHLLNGNHLKGKMPELWDGLTGQRVIEVLVEQHI